MRSSSLRPSRPLRAAALALASIVASATLDAQAVQPGGESACYGFSFGTWSPPLDWKAAGHPPKSATADPSAPGNRQWAVSGDRGDSLFVLFPSWWPAGVTVKVRRTPLAPGDTVPGQAVALVADGRLKPPTAPARVWAVRCAGSSR